MSNDLMSALRAMPSLNYCEDCKSPIDEGRELCHDCAEVAAYEWAIELETEFDREDKNE